MKAVLVLLVVAASWLGSARAQNLLVNGDFETNLLTPWTGTGGTVGTVGTNHNVTVTEGSIKQTVVTEAGVKYFVASDGVGTGIGVGATASLIAAPSGGGGVYGTKSFVAAIPGIPSRGGFYFTATSASTDVVFTGTGSPGFPGGGVFDNVVLYKIPASTLAGRYSGTMSTSIAITDPAISNKVSGRIVARITADSRIAIITGTTQIFSGLVLNDGTYELNGIGLIPARGTATVKGKRVTLLLPATTIAAADVTGTPLAGASTITLTLTKVGK